MNKGVRYWRVCGFVFALISLLGLGAVAAFGQAIDGSVIGTISDSSGAAVVGAEVTATNLATNLVLVAKTIGTGEYHFDHLPAGTYKITARMTGFKTISEDTSVEINK